MKYFRLDPINKDSDEFKAVSTHFNSVLVRAENEQDAREIAEVNLAISYGNSRHTQGVWTNTDYVSLIELNFEDYLKYSLKILVIYKDDKLTF
ncbi:hypothetical protein L3V86_08295 [Thiotrichales bacterium 19S11-10]|nr:hypothetical protein [Thiotrichales bacterium 19S11-10]